MFDSYEYTIGFSPSKELFERKRREFVEIKGEPP